MPGDGDHGRTCTVFAGAWDRDLCHWVGLPSDQRVRAQFLHMVHHSLFLGLGPYLTPPRLPTRRSFLAAAVGRRLVVSELALKMPRNTALCKILPCPPLPENIWRTTLATLRVDRLQSKGECDGSNRSPDCCCRLPCRRMVDHAREFPNGNSI
jgi:hypothetical protein